jgi:translation initiation factor IF-2
VPSKRPAARHAAQTPAAPRAASPALAGGAPKAPAGVSRDEIAQIVDRFLSQRPSPAPQTSGAPLPTAQPHAFVQKDVDIEPHRVSPSGGAAPQPEAAPTAQAHADNGGGGNGGAQPTAAAPPAPADGEPRPAPKQQPPAASANGKRAVEFVCEDDVRRAVQKGEKIYVGARTIITPAARDMGEAADVFAKA